MTQLGLFDPAASEQAAEEAIERVGENADKDWKQAVIEAIERVARKYLFFTTDHVWLELEEGYWTHERRAMGAMMRTAARLQICRTVNLTPQKSGRIVCHRRPLQVWESLIYPKGVQ